MPEQPFNILGESGQQRSRTLTDVLRDAHGRRLNALMQGAKDQREAERIQSTLPFDAFVDQVIREVETTAPERAKAIRDWRAQSQGGLLNARSEEDFLRNAQADGRFQSGLPMLAGQLNPFSDGPSLGTRQEQLQQAKEGSSFLRDAERLVGQGAMGFADVASAGLADVLTNKVTELRQRTGTMAEIGGRDVLAGMSPDQIRKGGEEAAVQDLDASGVNSAVTGGFRAAGELLGFFTAAGYVSRAGNMLKVAPGLGNAGSIVGRALQNPIVNFIAAEGLISEGEVRSAQLRGDTAQAEELRAGQGSRLANAAAFAAFAPAAKFFGRAAQNGILRVTGGRKGVEIGETLAQIPGLWGKARAAGAHVGGKAAEFIAFGFVPNVYTVNREGKTEMSPWFTTVLNPKAIKGAIEGGKGREEYLDALTTILEHGVDHAGQGGVTGGILGTLGLRGRVMDRSTLGKDFRGTVALGERGVGGEGLAAMPETQARIEGQAARAVNLRALREARKTLPPEQRRALKESLREGFENAENPETLMEGVTQFVVAAAEQQKAVLQRHSILPRDMRSTGDLVREFWEERLGPELFQGKLKEADAPGTGTTVEVKGDPDRPGQPGREGEVLEIIDTSPPDAQSAADPARRQVRLARVRFEDGTVGIFDMRNLGITGTRVEPRAEPGEAPPGPGGSNAGKGEAARSRGTQGSFGRVQDTETGAVGTLVRAHTSEDGRRLVDVRVGGELRTFDADRFRIVNPERLPEQDTGFTAPGGGTDQPGTTRQERSDERLGEGKVAPENIQAGVDRLTANGTVGLLDRIRKRFKLTENEGLHEEGRQIQAGRITGEDAALHQQRVLDRFYTPGEKPATGRGGNLLKAYRSLRRRFAGDTDRTPPAKLLGKMKATWDAMSPAQQQRAVQGIEDRLPHEQPGAGLDTVLRKLGQESRFLKAQEAPQEPQAASEPAPKADATPKPEAQEAATSVGEGGKEPTPRVTVTVPTPEQRGKDTGDRRRAGEVPKNETPEQRRERRLREVNKGRKAQAFTDKLTNLPNRAARERSQVRADAAGEATLLADLRGLKAFNAGPEGQVGGDKAIVSAGKRLLELAEKVGVSARRVFREGGDEFVVHGDAAAIERLKVLLEQDGERWHVATGESFEAASKALPDAKERNRKPDRAEDRKEAEEKDARAQDDKGTPPPDDIGDRPVERGARVEIRQEGTDERIPAQYMVVPVTSILPSHDPWTFEPSRGYPKGLQPRDYEHDTHEQGKVERIDRRFDPAEVVNTAPRASGGPPVVAWDPKVKQFVVLNGNGRTMGMLRHFGKDAEISSTAYEKFLREGDGASFGLGGEAADTGGVLVRVADLNPHGQVAREFARRGNLPDAQRQKPIDRAAAESDLLTDTILRDLNTEPGGTVLQAINGPAGRAFRQALRHRLGASANDLFTEKGDFTDAGKEFAEGMLTLKAGFTPTDLREFSPSIRRSAAASTMQFLQLRQNSRTKADAGILRDALRFVSKELENGRLTLGEWEAQGELFGARKPTPQEAVAIRAIQSVVGKPRVMRDALAKLVSLETDAPGQGTLIRNEPRPFVDRVADAFGLDVNGTDRAALTEHEESAAVGMPDPRNPLRRSELLPEHRENATGPPPDPISGSHQNDTPLTLPLERDVRPEFADASPLPASAIVDKVRELFRVAVLVGGTGDARAGYDSRGRVIRLGRANDLVGLTHEVGHGLEKHFATNDRSIQAEFARAGKAIYGENAPWNGYASEGVAEFVRLWLTDPAAGKRLFPKATKWFEKNVDFAEQGWRDKLTEIRKLAAQYVGQGSLRRADAFAGGKPQRPTALQELKPSNLAQKWVDQGAPVFKLLRKLRKAGVQIPFEADPGAAREALDNSHHAKARIMAEDGMIDFATNRVGPSMKDAIALVGREGYQDVVRLLVAKQALTINANGKTSGLDDRDALAIIKHYEGNARVQDAANIVWDWHRGLLSYMVEAKALTAGEAASMREAYPFYVPFQRIIGKAGGKGFGPPAGGPKRLKGSGREIVDPLEASIAQASTFLRWAHSKNFQHRLANLADLVPGLGQHVRLADPANVKRAKPLESFEKELRDAGIETEGLGESRVLDFLEARTIDTGDVLFPVKRGDGKDGKPKVVWYEASPEFYKSVQSADIHRFGPVMDLLVGKPARLKRLGTTGLRPRFAAVNVVRDYFVGLMQSSTRNPLTWSAEWVAGQSSAIKALFGKEDSWFRMYRAMGVEMSRQLSLDKAVREKLARNLGSTARERLADDVKNLRVLRLAEKGIDGLRDLIGVFEAGPRIAEMRIQAKRLGIDPTKPITLENMMRLSKAGRQVTVDFNAAGTEGRKWNAGVPFFNVAIQGPRRMVEAFGRDRLGFTLKALASITVPTLLLWDQNKDEDWYQDMPWWEKNAYWHLGEGISIPRPFEIGTIFASMPEAAFDADYRKDPRAVMEALAQMKEQFGPDWLPVLGREARDWLANEDSFTNAPIVPRIEEDLEEREQFGPGVSKAAVALGDALNISPRKIDHAIRGIGGGVSGDLSRVGGTVGDVRGEIGINPLDWFRRRGGEQGTASQAVQDVFDRRTELQKRVRSRLTPATPSQRTALRILERAARRLKNLRKERVDLKGEGPLAENLKAMRAIAKQALERSSTVLGE